MADSIFSEGLGSLAVGCLALAIGFSGIENASGWVSFMWLIVVIICASLMYFSIVLLSVVVCFWWDLPWGLLEATRPLGDLAQYPLDIYSSGVRFILTWIVPFGFTSFFPAATLLRPEEYSIYYFLIPGYTVAFFFLSYAIWLIGLRRYVGAGH
jgi:ABC-2 type transport system permease protein